MSEKTQYHRRIEAILDRLPEPLRFAYYNEALVHSIIRSSAMDGKSYEQTMEALAEAAVDAYRGLQAALVAEMRSRSVIVRKE